MTKTLELEDAIRASGFYDDGEVECIAHAVREWMLSDENVERAACGICQDADGDIDPLSVIPLSDAMPHWRLHADAARAALEAVIGRTDTQATLYACGADTERDYMRPQRLHGRSGDGDLATEDEE